MRFPNPANPYVVERLDEKQQKENPFAGRENPSILSAVRIKKMTPLSVSCLVNGQTNRQLHENFF